MGYYSIDDINFIRRKSGLSEQEILALLEQYNGDAVRVLLALERSGRLYTDADSVPPDSSAGNGRARVYRWLTALYSARIKVTKDDVTVLNLSVLVWAIALIFAHWLVIGGVAVTLLTGYRFSFIGYDPAFSGERFERLLHSMAKKIKAFVLALARKVKGNRKS